MKHKLIFLVLFLPFSTLIAQHHFKILGTSEFYNNQKLTIQPIQFNDIDFLDGKIELNKTQIEILHNNFNLSGKGNDYIQPLEVVYHDEQKNRFYVGVFFIDNISTTFEVNIPDLATDKTINVSNSKSQSEYNFILKKLAFEKIGVMPFDHNNLQKKNKFLHDYISMTPNSFVALWMIISDYRYVGYKNEFKVNLNLFGEKVKKSIIYKTLFASIKRDLTIDEGKKFPIELFNTENRPIEKGQKFTLIDFWFSYCKPCLDHMPEYKELYSVYKDLGFEIVGISTDRSQDLPNWRKVIEKNNLLWQNIVDENGNVADTFNINKFPSTFLLDANGLVLRRDISPEELEIFLSKNLKK